MATSDSNGGSFKAELIIAAGGLLTGILAAVGNFVFALNGLDVASFVPHGAGAVGLVAASGYYFAAIIARQRPSKRLLLNMLLVGVSTFALTEYLAYQAVTVEGVRLADVVPFWDYYKVKVEHLQISSLGDGGRPSDELGTLGYGWEAGRVLCFLFGSGLAFIYLQGKAYCESCKRYFGRRRMLLNTRDGAEVDRFAETLWFDVSDLAARYEQRISKQTHYGFRVWVAGCKTCGLKHLTFAVSQQYVKVPFAIYPYRGESPFTRDLPAATEVSMTGAEPARVKASA